MFAGLVAALLAFGVAWTIGEPQVDSAISFEESRSAPAASDHHDADGMAEDGNAAEGHSHEEAPEVSRELQSTLGLGVALVLFGTAVGGFFGLAYAFAQGRIGRVGPRGTAALVALAGYVAVVLVPLLKYPASPPAATLGSTIGRRTTLFFTLLLISIVLVVAAAVAAKRLVPRFGAWNGALLAVGGFVVAIGITFLVMPEVNEVPRDFPPTVLWNFRVASVSIQTVLWAVIGLLFGALTERSLRRSGGNASGGNASGRNSTATPERPLVGSGV
jgi:predicted cobalt transporter CbtA